MHELNLVTVGRGTLDKIHVIMGLFFVVAKLWFTRNCRELGCIGQYPEMPASDRSVAEGLLQFLSPACAPPSCSEACSGLGSSIFGRLAGLALQAVA
jgi:hypothetical protein